MSTFIHFWGFSQHSDIYYKVILLHTSPGHRTSWPTFLGFLSASYLELEVYC